MGLKDILTGLLGGLKRTPTAPPEPLSPQEQLVSDYRLRLIELHDEIPHLIPQRDAMRAAWSAGDFRR